MLCTRNRSRSPFSEKWRGTQKSIWGPKSQKPQKTSFLPKTPKTGKNHENGGGRFGGRKWGFFGGGEKRGIFGGAKRRFSSKPGLRDAPPKYLLFSMPPPPGGGHFYPPQNPQKHPPGPPQHPLWFWGRNWCFSGFFGHPAKTPKIDSFGFSPKMSFFRFLRTGSVCVAY